MEKALGTRYVRRYGTERIGQAARGESIFKRRRDELPGFLVRSGADLPGEGNGCGDAGWGVGQLREDVRVTASDENAERRSGSEIPSGGGRR